MPQRWVILKHERENLQSAVAIFLECSNTAVASGTKHLGVVASLVVTGHHWESLEKNLGYLWLNPGRI